MYITEGSPNMKPREGWRTTQDGADQNKRSTKPPLYLSKQSVANPVNKSECANFDQRRHFRFRHFGEITKFCFVFLVGWFCFASFLLFNKATIACISKAMLYCGNISRARSTWRAAHTKKSKPLFLCSSSLSHLSCLKNMPLGPVNLKWCLFCPNTDVKKSSLDYNNKNNNNNNFVILTFLPFPPDLVDTSNS